MGDTFSTRLMELIKARNISQKVLAMKAEVTEAAISHYLKGDRFPRAKVLARIAEALNSTSDYLMNGTSADSSEDIKQATRLIARNVFQMSKEEKMNIINILLSDD